MDEVKLSTICRYPQQPQISASLSFHIKDNPIWGAIFSTNITAELQRTLSRQSIKLILVFIMKFAKNLYMRTYLYKAYQISIPFAFVYYSRTFDRHPKKTPTFFGTKSRIYTIVNFVPLLAKDTNY